MLLAKYIVKRMLYGLIVLIAVSFFSFLIIELPPGDYVSTYISNMGSTGMFIDEQTIIAMRHSYGLDRPMMERYFLWVSNFVQGNMGVSFTYQKRVENIIAERLPLTLLLTSISLILTYSIAIPMAIYAGTHQYSIGDYITSAISFVGMATPDFLLAMIIMWFSYKNFGVSLGGLFSPEFLNQPMSWEKFGDSLKHIPLPIIVIATTGTASIIRFFRAVLLDELGKQYVITARSKGLKERNLILKYPVRSASNPLISSTGWILPELFSGETIISIVLGLPTLGPVLLTALRGEDMYLAASCVLIVSSLTVIGMLLSDILLAFFDPRIRFD